MSPIVQGGQRIGLETFFESINGDRMERQRGSLVGLLHRVAFLKINQDLVLRSAALGRSCHRCRHSQGSARSGWASSRTGPADSSTSSIGNPDPFSNFLEARFW